MVFEQLGKPRDYVDADEFGKIHGPAEACLIDRLQALWPHGFNIATITGMSDVIATARGIELHSKRTPNLRTQHQILAQPSHHHFGSLQQPPSCH